ncbi:hypothetical protein [Thalassiella azotivora]
MPATTRLDAHPLSTQAPPAWSDDAGDVERAARALAGGRAVAHPFATIYAISSRPEQTVVRRVNVLKGRRPDQVGSVTTTPDRLADLLTAARPTSARPDASVAAPPAPDEALAVVRTLLALGPCGFRVTAPDGVPAHLVAIDATAGTPRRTVQVIQPGDLCPSVRFVDRCLALTGLDYLHVTSANRSRHATGTAEEPPHHRADDLARDLGCTDLHVLRHPDEHAARRDHPLHAPTSTTVLSLHRAVTSQRGRRALVVDRHGSLSVRTLRALLLPMGWDVVLAPAAERRLTRRWYGPTDPT